ncbi:UNVERIFIED_CONTAM: hypothetical protein GTU68_035991 [Idotea baltica]|nr:hypothetical protein [Idotea baltica]
MHTSSSEIAINFNIHEQLVAKKTKLVVIGLGYVGLPIALEFAANISVIGFDINEARINMMQEGLDPSKEIDPKSFEQKDIAFTANVNDLAEAKFYVVAVPTPVNKYKVPNLEPLLKASETIGKLLKPGDYVVYESTVYPGCTEGDCVPILEKESGLKMGVDFKVGYSPERINPGDKVHTLTNVIKVVSGSDELALEEISAVYELVIDAGVFKAKSIKVAEAAKVIENTQRDLNIALMNELALIFDRMDINTLDVVEAAGTKWNFMKFFPGLVGGHCIGVDPYYLTYKSTELGYKPEVILSGRRINDDISSYVAKKAIQMIIRNGKNISKAKVLVMGMTFKENVSDIRNSKVIDLVRELESFSLQVHITDPYASNQEVKEIYSTELVSDIDNDYDCVVVAVQHDEYLKLDETYFKSISTERGGIIDIKSTYLNQINDLDYWAL